MRERRVAGDSEDAHSGGCELGLSVTQEQEFLGSGARPVEEVEDEEDRAFGGQIFELDRFAGLAPHHPSTLRATAP